MRRIYKNPEAKRSLLFVSLIFLIIGVLGSIGILLIQQHYQSVVNQNTTSLIAIHRLDSTQLDSYLKTGQLSGHIVDLSQQLLNLKVFPKFENYTLHGTITLLWIVLFVIFIIVFIVMTEYFRKLYQTFYTIDQFSYTVRSRQKPLDIRSNNEGDIAALKNELYATAMALHTQLNLETKQKEHLSKNIADISHQLKTPLTSLMLMIDTLRYSDITERTDEQLDLLEPQITRIESLIQSLLLLTRLDANATAFTLSHVDAQSFLTSIIEKLNILANSRGVTCQLSQNQSTLLHIDQFLMFEAISNVIKNAIEYAFKQSIIHITIDDNPFFSIINIYNEGPTIDAKELPYLFQRFYRGTNANKDGVGIGLSLAYEITQKHGGKLSVENKQSGVLFTFAIPK